MSTQQLYKYNLSNFTILNLTVSNFDLMAKTVLANLQFLYLC